MNWKTEIYRDEGCEIIKTEYRILLGTKMSDEEAERAIMEYCLARTVLGTPKEGRLWFALALTQWNYGRLTPTAKEKALHWLQFDGIVSEETRKKLKEALDSPMRKRRSFSLPPWMKPCPWAEGSLLAYRIITNTEHKTNPFGGKYVLLRIVRIEQPPYTFVAPEVGNRKNMFVALYNWCGDDIPDPSVVDTLEFTPIMLGRQTHINTSLLSFDMSALSPRLQDMFEEAVEAVENMEPEYSYQLDWKAEKGVFTYLGCDPNVKSYVPDYIRNRDKWILSHSNAFDLALMQRLKELSDAGELRKDS